MHTKRATLALLAAALALPALTALAGVRPFPADALRGKMNLGYFPDVTIDGKPRQFSAAGRIYNRDNLIQTSGSISGKDIVVNYTVDSAGFIHRAWILTQEEAAMTLPTTPLAAPVTDIPSGPPAPRPMAPPPSAPDPRPMALPAPAPTPAARQ